MKCMQNRIALIFLGGQFHNVALYDLILKNTDEFLLQKLFWEYLAMRYT